MAHQAFSGPLDYEEFGSEELFNRDFAEKLQRLENAQQQELVERARSGEIQARHDLVLSLTGYMTYLARKYTKRFAATSQGRIEFLDLVDVGYVRAFECLDKALAHPHPMGYLCKAIAGAIIHECQAHSSPITTPYDPAGKPLPPLICKSLHQPIVESAGDDESTLADFLPVETVLPDATQEPEPDYTALYQAIEELPEPIQEVMVRHYGLFGHETEGIKAIGWELARKKGTKDFTVALRRERKGRALLLARLQGVRKPDATPETIKQYQLSPTQRSKLDEAYRALQHQGQKITTKGLARSAHVYCYAASAYLYQRRHEQQEATA